MRRPAPSSAGKRGRWKALRPSRRAVSRRHTPHGAPPPPSPGRSPRTTRAGRRAGRNSRFATPLPATPRRHVGPSAGRSGPGRRRRPGSRAWAWPTERGARASICGSPRSTLAGTTLSPARVTPGYSAPGGRRRSPAARISPADRAATLEEAQEQRAGGLSWREASQVAIWRALAALREEAGDGVAALDARHRAEAIERDPVSFGPERLATATAGQPVSDLRRLEAAVYLTPVVLHRR